MVRQILFRKEHSEYLGSSELWKDVVYQAEKDELTRWA